MITALVIRLVSLRSHLPPLQAVQLPNGEVGVTLRSLCRILQLNVLSQRRRIAHSYSLRGALTKVTVATRGGPQEADVLLAWAVPLWAATIEPNHLTATKRDIAVIIQQEGVPALYRAFWDAAAPQAAPAAIPEIASSDPLEARVAALEATVRDEIAKREAMETALRDEIAQRTTLARRLARSEALLVAAIQRLLSPGNHPKEPPPDTLPPRRGPGRPRRRK